MTEDINFEVKINFNDSDTIYTFSEWDEVPEYLNINYSELGTEGEEFNLPAIGKQEWEAFKRAGDIVFENM